LAGNGSIDLPQTGKSATREEPRGLVAELLSLLGSFARHIQALSALAGEESREALALGVRLGVMLLAALFFAAFGYVLLILAVAFFAAHVLGISWLWILGAFTLVHFLLAYICANHVRRHARTPIFETTRREISVDLESLRKRPQP
jgi:uncharacterized membrane protein YqjE